MAWLPHHPYAYPGKTAAPTVDDDQNDGYQVSDIWIDETNDQGYILVDITAGAAVWLKLTARDAVDVSVDVTNFDGILGAGDTDLQTALETIDDHLHDGQTLQNDAINSDGGSFTITVSGDITITDGIESIALIGLHTNSKEPTGFLNRTDSSISFVNATRVFTIEPAVTSYQYYRQGNLVTKNAAATTTLDNLTQLNYIYFDSNDALQNATSFSFGAGNVLVAIVYYDTDTNDIGLLTDERHGYTMDWATHEHFHDILGSAYQSGFALSFDNTTLTIGSGYFHDEDIEHSISEQTTCTILYRQTAGSPSTWAWDIDQSAYYKEDGGSDILYDNAGTPTALASNKYCAYWIFVTNDTNNPIWSVMGQRTDNTIADARANNTFEALDLTGLPSNEALLIARVIVRNDATPYEETEDYRGSFLTGRSTQQYGASNVASGITTDVTNFDAILSALDTDVQTALETLDDHLHDGQTLEFDAVNSDGGAFTFTTSGAVTFTQNIIIPDAGNIGSVSDVDAIAIAANGEVTLSQELQATLGIAITAAQKLYLDGGGDTYILESGADILTFYAGGARFLDLVEAAQDEFVVNQAGADIDFRVEASGVSSAFFVEGSSGFLYSYRDDSGAQVMHFQNSTTGSGSGQGFIVGIASDESAYVWHYETDHISIGTNNTEHWRVKTDGHLEAQHNHADIEYVGSTGRLGTMGFAYDDNPFVFGVKDMLAFADHKATVTYNTGDVTLSNGDRIFNNTGSSAASAVIAATTDSVIVEITLDSSYSHSLGSGAIGWGWVFLDAGIYPTTVTVELDHSGDGYDVTWNETPDERTWRTSVTSIGAPWTILKIRFTFDDWSGTGTAYLCKVCGFDVMSEMLPGYAAVDSPAFFGVVTIGVSDDEYGALRIYGDATGSSQGGIVSFYTAADYDTNCDRYVIEAYNDDFYIGPIGNPNAIKMTGAAVAHDISEVVFNEASYDVDFRVESNDDAYAIFVDASKNYVGIMNASPAVELDVTGDIALSGHIDLDSTPSADHKVTGIVEQYTAGEDLVFGDFCYFKSDGKMWKSDADAETTMPVIAMAAATISADASGDFLMFGTARDDTWTWTVGALLFASTTAGKLTETAPSGTADMVQAVAIAMHADRIQFNPDKPMVKHT